MNGTESRRNGLGSTVVDIAELVLELPQPPRARADKKKAPRRHDSELVPDHGSDGDLVPDGWGGISLV